MQDKSSAPYKNCFFLMNSRVNKRTTLGTRTTGTSPHGCCRTSGTSSCSMSKLMSSTDRDVNMAHDEADHGSLQSLSDMTWTNRRETPNVMEVVWVKLLAPRTCCLSRPGQVRVALFPGRSCSCLQTSACPMSKELGQTIGKQPPGALDKLQQLTCLLGTTACSCIDLCCCFTVIQIAINLQRASSGSPVGSQKNKKQVLSDRQCPRQETTHHRDHRLPRPYHPK